MFIHIAMNTNYYFGNTRRGRNVVNLIPGAISTDDFLKQTQHPAKQFIRNF